MRQIRTQHTGPDVAHGQRTAPDTPKDKSDLANIDIGTISVDLRVVGPQHGRVDAVIGHDLVAGVTSLDDVGRLAVLALVAKAEDLIGLEVVAGSVNLRVRDRELVTESVKVNNMRQGAERTRRVRGDVLFGRDGIANIARLDGVGARAISSSHGGYTRRSSVPTTLVNLHCGGNIR